MKSCGRREHCSVVYLLSTSATCSRYNINNGKFQHLIATYCKAREQNENSCWKCVLCIRHTPASKLFLCPHVCALTQNNPKIDFVSLHPNQSNKNKFHNNLTVANTGKYWLVTCSQSVRFFWPFFLFTDCLNNETYSVFGEEWKAAMSKRTDFNALKISLHLSQNNRSMPVLLSYSWDNVSAWKSFDICNGETLESVKHTSYGFERKKKERKKYICWSEFRTILIKFLRLWWFSLHPNTFIVCYTAALLPLSYLEYCH